MTASEQNGIDILCDAAGSDMLLSSLFSLASPHQQNQQLQQRQQSLEQDPQQSIRHQTPRSQASSLPSKRKLSDASLSSPTHVCHICKRVYERADHLTRHLRSHENARPYQCSRCPKRFNRADLLTRHETTHDRDGGSKGRPFIRRSDRAAEACLNCAASKAKCEDQKPCSRCRNKSLNCQMPPRRGQQYRTSDGVGTTSPSETSTMASVMGLDSHSGLPTDVLYGLSRIPQPQDQPVEPITAFDGSLFGNTNVPSPRTAVGNITDDMMYFNPILYSFEDTRFSLNDKSNGEPGLSSSLMRWPGTQTTDAGDFSLAAFKRSAWIFEPNSRGLTYRENDGQTWVGEEVTNPSVFQKLPNHCIDWPKITSNARDCLFAMVLAQTLKDKQSSSLPTLEYLNQFLQAHFAQDELKCDAFVHTASIDPEDTIPELLSTLISSGATDVSMPAAWHFGLALDDVTRSAIHDLVEKSRHGNHDLATLQAFMVHLDIGQWSGFNRKMEDAESSLLSLLTLLRRAGKMSFSSEMITEIPSTSDSTDVLQLKWKQFIARESYKRLAMRLFFHDVQSSIGLCKKPLMSLTELNFSLPASRDLWTARSADEWRDIMLSKSSVQDVSTVSRVAEVLQINSATELEDRVDKDLCYMAYFYGLWGQICSYRDAVKLYGAGSIDAQGPSSPVWLSMQYHELYRTIREFASPIQRTGGSNPQLIFLAEVFMLALHVSFDDLQHLIGKNGEDSLRKTAEVFNGAWISGSESRYAAWHAGQVLRHARTLPPTALRGFNALAVYFAGLTLRTYGLASSSINNREGLGVADQFDSSVGHFLVNDDESRESTVFLQLGQGTPFLETHDGSEKRIEPLTKPGFIVEVTQSILRNNYPLLNEPMPPFVESLRLFLNGLRPGYVEDAIRGMSDNLVQNSLMS